MKRRITVLGAVLFIGPVLAWCQPNVMFEATIARLEPWGMLKIACGAFANYRLAEYRVDVVYSGRVKAGQSIVMQHLACNYNELDDLKVGDKALVVASVLSRPRTAQWGAMSSDAQKGDNVTVSYSAEKVAKVVYPTKE